MHSHRRLEEPHVAVPHRTMFSISYGPDTPASERIARGFELRDLLLYDNATYGCGYSASNACAKTVASANWRRFYSIDG